MTRVKPNMRANVHDVHARSDDEAHEVLLVALVNTILHGHDDCVAAPTGH
jgi:hypothetical protein